jgi:hypothetical protein
MTQEEAVELLSILRNRREDVPPVDTRKLAYFYIMILGSLRE